MLPLDNFQNETVTREDFYEEYMKSELEVRPAESFSRLSFRLLQIFCDNKTALGDSAARDIFIWACFSDQFKFATYLCSKTWVSVVDERTRERNDRSNPFFPAGSIGHAALRRWNLSAGGRNDLGFRNESCIREKRDVIHVHDA